MIDQILKVKDLQTGYGKQQVIYGVNLSVHPGEVSALIGPNGSGKSTLIKAISCILPAWKGKVFIDGYDLLQTSTQERARLLSVIPQARNLPPAFLVREVIRMGRTPYINWLGNLSKEDEEQVDRAMYRTDTEALADRQLGELSGGEQQRVLVARAIAQQPKVLLLDEPTTHLDISYQQNLMKLIVNLAHEDNVTVLMAVHDLDLVSVFADSAHLLVKGKIRTSGSPQDVLNSDILSEAYNIEMNVLKLGSGKLHVYPE